MNDTKIKEIADASGYDESIVRAYIALGITSSDDVQDFAQGDIEAVYYDPTIGKTIVIRYDVPSTWESESALLEYLMSLYDERVALQARIANTK